jgi:HSP20 family protein
MQDTTKKEPQQNSTNVQRGTAPVRILQVPRVGATGTDSVREAQLSLVRAEQNLYKLIGAGQPASAATFGAPSIFGPQGVGAFPTAYAPNGFSNGLAGPTAPVHAPPLGFGIVPGYSPWNASAAAGPAVYPLGNWQSAIPAIASAPYTSGLPPAFVPSALSFGARAATQTLACDITDEGKQFICELELPGVQADQVELFCFEGAVVINAFRDADGEIANLVQSERGNGTQQRVIPLPGAIRPEACKATLSDGILTVVLPKTHPTDGPRRIPVEG